MAHEHRRNSDPVSPRSDVFSDAHALEPSDEPHSPSSTISHDGPSRTANPLASSVRPQQSSPARSSSMRNLSLRSGHRSRNSQPHPHAVSSTAESGINSNDAGDESTQSSKIQDPRPRRGGSNGLWSFVPRSQSPYSGATGPSQPYGMYPQGIQSRTTSIATSINPRSSRRSVQGAVGPTQPYGLYPQNTVPEDEASERHQQAIPIGFPGHTSGHAYQRRMGPEGEDYDDMIGPLGHTEPLPPYTRYANDLPLKEGMPVDVDTRPPDPNPPQQSQETIEAEHSDQSTDRGLVSPQSPTLVDSVATSPSERPEDGGHFKEKITERGKKKVFGTRVPLWLLLIVIVLLLIAIILGGVLGQRARNQDPPKKSQRRPPPV